MKKRYIIGLSVIVVLIVLLISFTLYMHFHPFENKEQIKVNVLDSISEYGYTLDDRDSNLFKEEFNKLKEIIDGNEINEEEYSEAVAKLFIIDLYSIKTKVNKYDVGGKEFYYTDKVTMYENKVKDTLYDLVEDDSYGNRTQQLPVVSKIETKNITVSKYKLDENEVDSYVIELVWEYERDLDYDNKGFVTIVKDGIKQSVVAFSTELDETQD